MTESETIISYVLFFVGIIITLLVPLPIKEEYRIFIITILFFIFLVMILYKFNEKIEEKNEQINDLNKRFKTIEELNEIRLDIRELKRKVFKND